MIYEFNSGGVGEIFSYSGIFDNDYLFEVEFLEFNLKGFKERFLSISLSITIRDGYCNLFLNLFNSAFNLSISFYY